MTTEEKIQLVIDVANGQQSLSVLKSAIDDGGDAQPNFIKMAVDFCVASTMKTAGNGTQFRFKITENGRETFTEWEPETGHRAALGVATRLRREHPTAALHVERQYV